MLPPYLADQIDNWASEFPESEAARGFAPEALAEAVPSLAALLKGACERAGGSLEDVSAVHLQAALTGLSVTPPPPMLRAFFEYLESSGRLGGGAEFGRLLSMAARQPKTVRNPGSKIGRNDPCPCGSGKKYKACCLGG